MFGSGSVVSVVGNVVGFVTVVRTGLFGFASSFTLFGLASVDDTVNLVTGVIVSAGLTVVLTGFVVCSAKEIIW